VRILDGSPHYTDSPSADLRSLINGFLQKYQAYSGTSDIEEMRNMLDTVDVTQNTTTTADNLKLTVSVNSFSSSFNWRYTIDGTDYAELMLVSETGTSMLSATTEATTIQLIRREHRRLRIYFRRTS